MIPWFIVNIIDSIAWICGRSVYVQAVSGGWGAERVHLMPREPGAPRPGKLAPYHGGPLIEGDCDRPSPDRDANEDG